MMRTVIVLVMVAAIFIAPPILAAEKEIYPCEAETAILMNITSAWGDIYNAAIALPSACFDGYFSEGISDTLVRKMGQDWSGFISVLVLHPKDSRFMKLILESINSTLDPNDIRAIDRLAQTSCRAEVLNHCRAISKEAAAALADYDPPESRNGT